jgi:hypothetical protein
VAQLWVMVSTGPAAKVALGAPAVRVATAASAVRAQTQHSCSPLAPEPMVARAARVAQEVLEASPAKQVALPPVMG